MIKSKRVKKVEIELNIMPQESHVYVDGKELPVSSIRLFQNMDNLLQAEIKVFVDSARAVMPDVFLSFQSGENVFGFISPSMPSISEARKELAEELFGC